MLRINKLLKITSNKSSNYKNIIFNEINVFFSKPYTHTLYKNDMILTSNTKIKIDDLIQVNISIENQSNMTIPSLKLNLLDDNNFTFIPGSLINSHRKECYFSENINDNSYLLYDLLPKETLNLSFFIKATFKSINYIKQSNANILLIPCFSSRTLILEDVTEDIIATLNQAIIKINSDYKNGIVKIENMGNLSANNILLKYSAPSNFKADVSTIKASLNNELCNISVNKINDDIFFNIPSIPACKNNIPSNLTITFKSIDLNSLNSFKITID